MSSALRKFLSEHADSDLLSVATIKRHLEIMGEDGPENVSTVQAAKILGYSAKRWRVWCEAGKVDGAWQDTDSGYWRLPITACRAHILRLRNKPSKPGARRGPWLNKQSRSA